MASSSKNNPLSKTNKTSTSKASSRLPPPSLFQGPPSHNASSSSLTPALFPNAHTAAIGAPSTNQQRNPLLRQRSLRNQDRLQVQGDVDPLTGTSPLSRPPTRQEQLDGDRADALWMEMQNTLAEVELSTTNGAQLFGAEHAKALEELRTAQLALAQAWSRSEADEAGEKENLEDGGKVVKGVGLLGAATTTTGAGAGTQDQVKKGEKKRDKENEKEKQKQNVLEQETANDVTMARKRREANDRYFQRVNNGVLDVVAKLDDVATAMRSVEKESREIWSETESLETTATAATG